MNWGITLRGRKSDLDHWRDMLRSPFEPFVELVEQDGGQFYVLSSDKFQYCANEDEVMEASIPLLRKLNALAEIERNCGPVDVLTVAKRDASGRIVRQIAAAVGRAQGRSFVFGVAAPGGIKVSPPQPSFAQVALANASDELSEALEHFSRASNWYDLYKTFEAIENICGDRSTIPARCKVAKGDVTTCARNINFHRHHRPDPIETVWSLNRTKHFVGRLLVELLKLDSTP